MRPESSGKNDWNDPNTLFAPDPGEGAKRCRRKKLLLDIMIIISGGSGTR